MACGSRHIVLGDCSRRPPVLRRLTAVAEGAMRPARVAAEYVIRGFDGKVIARGPRATRGGVALTVPVLAKQDREAVLRALTAVTGQFMAAGK